MKLRAALCIGLLAISARAASTVDLCTAHISLEASGEVLIVVTLEKPAIPTKDPIIGASEMNRISVAARLDEVRKGNFDLRVGQRFELAVHSVVLTFGSDYAGERYVVGLDRTEERGYRIVSIVPAESERFQLRGTVLAGKPATNEKTIDLDREGKVVRLQVTSVEGGLRAAAGDVIALRLRVRKNDPPKPGQSMCVFAMHRPKRHDRPYRTLRVVY